MNSFQLCLTMVNMIGRILGLAAQEESQEVAGIQELQNETAAFRSVGWRLIGFHAMNISSRAFSACSHTMPIPGAPLRSTPGFNHFAPSALRSAAIRGADLVPSLS
jgi:hypothetical protein